MRNLIVSNAMSLNGYYTGYTGPDDNVIVLELDPAFDAYNATPTAHLADRELRAEPQADRLEVAVVGGWK